MKASRREGKFWTQWWEVRGAGQADNIERGRDGGWSEELGLRWGLEIH